MSRGPASEPARGPEREEPLAARLPPIEAEQPDPLLQLSVGSRMGPGALTAFGLAAALIIGVVFYALNAPDPNAQNVGTPPGAASAPAAGGGPGAAAPQPQRNTNTGHS